MSVHLKKLPVQINVVTVIGYIILIAFYTKGYSQEEDTSMVVADSISFSEDDDSVSIGIEIDNADDKECEDLTGYGLSKTKKSLSTKIDLKI